jgi:hypothetical protein
MFGIEIEAYEYFTSTIPNRKLGVRRKFSPNHSHQRKE